MKTDITQNSNEAKESRKDEATAFAKQCFVTAAVGLNVVGYGAMAGFPGILLAQLREPGSGLSLTRDEESWIASIFVISMLCGNFLMSSLMDRLGRRLAHCALCLPFLLGWVMTTLATDLKVHIAARLMLGISGGLLNVLRSVLIGEYTSPKNRGAFLSTISLAQASGIFFVHLVGSLLSWQKTALVCAFFPFLSLCMSIYIPESPSWLAARGRYDECREVFRWLRGTKEEEELQHMIDAQRELGMEKLKISSDQNRFRNTLATLSKEEFYKPIILMVHANALLQFSGATTMSNYPTLILGLLMGPSTNVYFWMVFLDAQRIITNAIAIFVIHRVKRRTMIFSNGGICVLSHLAMAGYMYGRVQGWITESVWLPVLLVNIQVFTVGMAMVPMPNIIAGEIFALEYRSVGGTISSVASGFIIFFALKTFPGLIEATGLQGTYLLYSIILIYNMVVLWVLLPETKGKTLQQIEDEFRGRPSKPHEVESRMSLQSNSIEMYQRKTPEHKYS